jgi:hypothetical protein
VEDEAVAATATCDSVSYSSKSAVVAEDVAEFSRAFIPLIRCAPMVTVGVILAQRIIIVGVGVIAVGDGDDDSDDDVDAVEMLRLPLGSLNDGAQYASSCLVNSCNTSALSEPAAIE